MYKYRLWRSIFFGFSHIFGKNKLSLQHQGRVSQDRVLYRGNNNANPNGGVSYTNANNDASNSNANLGARLDYCFHRFYGSADVSASQ